MSLSSLSRAELQALAKQHGIRANMKNAEIEAALIEKGISQPKKAGLSVRDPNVQTEAQKPSVKAKAIPKPASTKEVVSAENDENLTKNSTNNRIPRSASIVSNLTDNTISTNVTSELPPIARRSSRLSRSSTNDERNSISHESSQETMFTAPSEENQITRRRSTRRSSISSQSDASSSSQAESLPSTQEPNSDEQATSESNSEEGIMEKVDAIAEGSKPKREKPAKYASRRKSAEREVVLAEIMKESVVTMETKIAVGQADEEQKETIAMKQEVHQPVLEEQRAENQSKEAETSVIQETVAAKQISTPSVISSASASNESGKRSGRQIRVPEMPRTPQVQHPIVEAQQQQPQVENAPPAGAEIKENVQPEAASVPPVAESNKAFVVPQMKRMAPLPLILPPTPPVVKQKREERLAMEKNDVDRLLGHYKGALEALSFVPDLLRRQKELLNELEFSKQENKRLREYIGMSE